MCVYRVCTDYNVAVGGGLSPRAGGEGGGGQHAGPHGPDVDGGLEGASAHATEQAGYELYVGMPCCAKYALTRARGYGASRPRPT